MGRALSLIHILLLFLYTVDSALCCHEDHHPPTSTREATTQHREGLPQIISSLFSTDGNHQKEGQESREINCSGIICRHLLNVICYQFIDYRLTLPQVEFAGLFHPISFLLIKDYQNSIFRPPIHLAFLFLG